MIKRHIQYVNSIGYDAVAFDLSFHKKWLLTKPPISRTKNIGLRFLWGDEIEDVLNHYSGPKIVYAFSNPSSCAIDAMARRECKDILGLICDSGPFMKMFNCSFNLTKHYFKLKNPILQIGGTIALYAGWGILHNHHLEQDLASFPKSFPILSFRSWQDKLVPLAAIERAFHDQNHLDLQIVNLPESEHLDGIKTAPVIYKEKLKSFLENISTKVLYDS